MRFHVHVDIKQALEEWDDKQLTTIFHGEDGESLSVHVIKTDLYKRLESGELKLSAGDCDNKNPDGSCAGHETIKETGQTTLEVTGDA